MAAEQTSYEILARFWVKAANPEIAEKIIAEVFEETKRKLKTDFTVQLQVNET
jgi:hypothetical protein